MFDGQNNLANHASADIDYVVRTSSLRAQRVRALLCTQHNASIDM